MITATRRIQFCAGHRVFGHESKCSNLHGHNYVALIEARGVDSEVDGIGRVVDFSVLKDEVGNWIDRNWDHGFILKMDDIEAIRAVSGIHKQKLFLMEENPTAENMAKYLLNGICPMLLACYGVEVVSVTIWETENCFAIARK